MGVIDDASSGGVGEVVVLVVHIREATVSLCARCHCRHDASISTHEVPGHRVVVYVMMSGCGQVWVSLGRCGDRTRPVQR